MSEETDTIYQFSVQRASAQGDSIKNESLDKYRGKVLLVVNVASKCGFTKQYEGLQKLYEKYSEQGLEILAFPCNQFGEQEPGTDAEVLEFCSTQYNVSFPVFSKIEVNGANENPMYHFLKAKQKGVLGSKAIKWNFTKFLVDKNGVPADRFAPKTTPEELDAEIAKLL